MRKKQKKARLLATILALIMLVGILPLPIYAENADAVEENDTAQEETLIVAESDDWWIEAVEEPLEEDEPPLETETAENEDILEDDISEYEPISTENEPYSDNEDASDDSDNREETHTEEPVQNTYQVAEAIMTNGYAHIKTMHEIDVYAEQDMQEHVFTIAPGAVLLATDYSETDGTVAVQFLTELYGRQLAYAYANDLPDTVLNEEAVQDAMLELYFEMVAIGDEEAAVFNADASRQGASEDVIPVAAQQMPANENGQTFEPMEQSNDEAAFKEFEETQEADISADIPAEEVQSEVANEDEHLPEQISPDENSENPLNSEQLTAENEQEAGMMTESEATEAPASEQPLPDIADQPQALPEETSEGALFDRQTGDFVFVDRSTRVFSEIDDTAAYDYNGDFYMGTFINDAIVQIEQILTDSLDRTWYEVRYMYGDTFADGTLKWMETDTVYILASEASDSAEWDLTVTDYAFPFKPRAFRMLCSASPMNGFTLKDISVYIPTFYAGQSGLYGSSGKDSDYLQIAKEPDQGTIYATPHYLDGFSVYCLEHNLPGPGENMSGGGQQPTGPYMIVDIDSYRNTPGYSSIIYNDSTLHAIGWVLRHTYPFMALDRSDSDNLTWSRVAGQFAIRQVIREMEGAQYVRGYWNMDNFYRASGQAPEVYLEYARWLASNGIARGRITGNITVSGKSTTASGSSYKGTVTLSTDADLMRISKSAGSITGNTAGSDGSYYYLNSGDTISVTSTKNTFSVTVESISSADEEASFVVGVPSDAIQKVIIPQYGAPYKLKSVSVKFDMPLGSVKVTKKDKVSGTVLSGAVFELLNTSGSVLQTQTTGSNGVATFSNLQPGSYRVREKSAPQGYLLAAQATQNVTVTAGNTSNVSFSNDVKTSKIRIMKKDALTKEALAGAEFTVTRLSAPAGRSGINEVVAVLTTDENGSAETGWLTWGRYKVEETTVPAHFVNNRYSTIIEAYEDGKTYSITVENEPTKGCIRIVKTDALDGAPIAGVTFDIYYNDEYGSGLAGSMTTDKDGVAVSPAIRKGSYIVRERNNPVGYVSELSEMETIVRSDETTRLTATNQPIQGKIRIVKKDELTKEALAGAEFTITRISGLPSHNGKGNGEAVAVIVTDANGIAESPLLTWGTYLVEETKMPAHFVDNTFSCEVVIDTENLKTYELVVENEPTKGFIKLTKTDRQNGNPIEGVQFDIYYNDQYGEGLAATMVTDVNGIAVSEPLRKGRYIVRENGETEGYLFEEITLDATVKSDETTELQATNRHATVKLRLYKRDSEEYDGDDPNTVIRKKAMSMIPKSVNISAPATRGDGVLTGAEFRVLAGAEIQDRQGNTVFNRGDVVVDSIKTEGEDASATTGELWPGLYEIVEVTPPVGYKPDDIHFFVDTSSAAYQSAEAVITYDGLKTNEILYGAFAITKFTGDNEVHSDAGIIETPEAGAEFEVYLKRAGSYANARGFERDYIITNKYGRARTKALPYGVYVLHQVVGKEGYAIMRPIDIMIDGTESLKNPPSLILNNQAIHYRLRIVKLDAETGKPIALAGTAFKLKDADGSYVKQSVNYPAPMELDTFVTNESGEVTLPETVTWGQYFVEEVISPEGYLLNTDNVEFFVGHAGDNVGEVYEVTVEIPNVPVKGRIAVDKNGLQLTGFDTSIDAWGYEVHTPVYEEGYLAGAVFEIRAAEDIIGKDGTVWYQAGEVADTITTTANGADTSKLLPLGKYSLAEVEAPDGYFFDSTPIEVELLYADDKTPVIEVGMEVYNDYLPAEISLSKLKEDIRISKSDNDGVKSELTEVPGEGFVFGLYSTNDIRYANGILMADTLVATGATDIDGKLTFAGYFPHGDFYIRELSAPDGWIISAECFPITLSPDNADEENIIRVSVAKPILNEIEHTYVTLTKTDLSGAESLPGCKIEVTNESGEVICRAVTDEHGKLPEFPVKPGKYTFREIYAPDGYAIYEDALHFTVGEDGIIAGDMVIRDDYTRFAIEKHDENHKPLAGVEFSLIAENGTAIMSARTDKNGIAVFEKVQFGSYRIEETKPLAGYQPAQMDVQITVDGTFINPDKPLASIMNCANEVLIQKTNQDGEPLSGAEFALVDAFDEVFATAVSDANGIVRFSKIPFGSYVIRETQSPNGYLICKKDIPITVDADFRSDDKPICTVVNALKRVRFTKVDTSGKHLPGVEFSLINAVTLETVETVRSNENGEFIFTEFDYGDWIVRETEAPSGYSRMEDVLLHVDENWTEPEPITLVNIPNTYSFFKSDNDKNALSGAVFAVEDENGSTVQEAVSGDNGVVYIENLMPGRYVIREIQSPEGFVCSEDVIEVIIDSEYKPPEKLKRFVNYPSISTGIDIMPNTVTWIGVGLAVVAGVVLLVVVKGKKNKRTMH